MNPLSLKLVLVEEDGIMCIRDRAWLVEMPVVQSVSAFASYEALSASLPQLGAVDMFLLGSTPVSGIVWDVCRRYPEAGLLFISDRHLPTLPRNTGAVGYCPKSRLAQELEPAITTLAQGRFYASLYTIPPSSQLIPLTPWQLLRHNLRAGALQQIEQTLQSLPREELLPLWQRWVQQGRKRELRSARWLISQVLFPEPPPLVVSPANLPTNPVPIPPPVPTGSMVQALLEAIADKIRHPQQTLSNLSASPMEIDILRLQKKRELLLAVLHHWQATLQELKAADIALDSINYNQLLQHLWRDSATSFLGRYFRIGTTNVLEQVLTEAANVELTIPKLPELLAHLLKGEPLTVDNANWSVGSPTAMRHAEQLTENLIIAVANGVMQAVLNQFAHAEAMKQQFYQHNLLATRDIERFRNELSWKYRRWKYVDEPRAIFESYYPLLTITEMGIRSQKIYAPRTEELENLQGLRYGITIFWEFQDAIAPRIKALASWLGSLVVYVLTNIIGRGLGLVGRGILQGIGSAFNSRRIQG